MNNGILELCAITLIVAAYDGPLEPLIAIRRICRTSMEVTCSLKNGNHELWAIYRGDSLNNLQSMAKIADRKSECLVSVPKLSKSTRCICETNRINCTILDDTVADAGYLWLCGIYKHSSVLIGKPQFVEMETFDECTTTYVAKRVTEESIASFTTTDIGRTADTEEVLKDTGDSFIRHKDTILFYGSFRLRGLENIKTENFTMTTIQNANTVEQIERQGSHDKTDITQLALMIAGPFVVFDIGLIMFIFRKRLLSCFGGKHDVARVHCNQNTSADGNFNVGAEFNNGDCSNSNTPSRERVPMRQPTTGQNVELIRVALNGGQQAEIDTDECIEDDPLYSRVQGNVIPCAEIVSVPMEVHVVSDHELIGHTIQTTTEETSARRANSVHLYDSIPPSPIADISFSGFADDTEFDAVTDESIEDAGRYESLDQNTREEMAYSINFLDRNTLEDVMNTIDSHGQHTEDTTHYINLNL